MISRPVVNRPQPTVFVSYSHKDKTLKEKFCKLLKDKGFNVLSDSENRVGLELHKEISSLLNQAHYVISLITQSWLNSAETRDEFVRAHERRKLLICLVKDDDNIDEKKLPFFIKEDLQIRFTETNIDEKFEVACTTLSNANFSDYWKNNAYDYIRKIGDAIQESDSLHRYMYINFERKLKKVYKDLNNIKSDNYETPVSYEENFLWDALPYFEEATQIYAVSVINISTFWTDSKAIHAAHEYLKAQGSRDKDVIRLFVFKNARQVHYFRRILLRNYNHYVQEKQNMDSMMSGVLVCSKRSYQKLIRNILEVDPVRMNIDEEDFGMLVYQAPYGKHRLYASLNSSKFKVKCIDIEEEPGIKSFIEVLEQIVREKHNRDYGLKEFGIAKMNSFVFEDAQKWNAMVDALFSKSDSADIFHVIYFKVPVRSIGRFEEIISGFISELENSKDTMKIKAISLRKFKRVDNARDAFTRGELQILSSYNYALNVIFADKDALEKYYTNDFHSTTREELYKLLNNNTRTEFRKLHNNRLPDHEKQVLYNKIESMMSDFILRVDWEQYDTKNSITPIPF